MKNQDPPTGNNRKKVPFEFVAHVAAQSVCSEHGNNSRFRISLIFGRGFHFFSSDAGQKPDWVVVIQQQAYSTATT